MSEEVRLEIYWAEALRSFPEEGETSLQDRGVHARLRMAFP
jgi:hypothetical protein